MKVVSDALYEAIHKRNRKFKLRLDFGEFQITNAENYKTELISSPSSGLAVGCVAIGSGSFEIKNNVVDVANKVFRAYIGMEIQGQMEWVKLGKYTVKNIEKKGTKDVVSFENDISLLDVRFDETLTLPTSSTAVLERIETICGVKFDFNSFNVYTVIDRQFEGYSCRDIVGWIAQLMGLFVVVDNETEQISAKWYVDSGYVINDTNYLYMIDEPTTDAHFRLDAISCQTGLETLVASNENAVGVMSISNPLMTQSRLDVIFSKRKNFEYDEGELSFLLGNPLFDPWDIITVEYRGKTSVFPVMSLSFAFNGGFTTKVKAFVRDEDTAFEGNITKQIADVKTKVTILDGYVATEVVKNGEVVTAINASDEEATIKANKINLVGLIESIFAQKINVSGEFTATTDIYIPPNSNIYSKISAHLHGISIIPNEDIPLYDFNGNGVIDSEDLSLCIRCENGEISLQEAHKNAQKTPVTITIKPSDISKSINITGIDMWGQEVIQNSMGVNGIKTNKILAQEISTFDSTTERSGGISTSIIEANSISVEEDIETGRLKVADYVRLGNPESTPFTTPSFDIYYNDFSDEENPAEYIDLVPLVRGLTGNIQSQLNARKITWECPTKVGEYSTLCFLDRQYASYLLNIRFFQTNQALSHTYLITQGYATASITQVGGSGFQRNNDLSIRLVQDSRYIETWVELLNNFSYDGTDTIIAHCSCTPLSDMGTCIGYTTYTEPVGGTVVDEITSIPSGLAGALGKVVYEVDPNTTNGIYCNGKTTADSVNSVTISDQWKKYKRLKIYARFPQGTHIQEFDLETTALGASDNFGNRVGGILVPTGDNVGGASRHYLYKLNFCVRETSNGWTFQVTDGGWVNMGIPNANASQYATVAVTISGTAYQAFNQRHNSDYCIYKIVGYEN